MQCVCGEDASFCAELFVTVLSLLTAFLLQHAFAPAANFAFDGMFLCCSAMKALCFQSKKCTASNHLWHCSKPAGMCKLFSPNLLLAKCMFANLLQQHQNKR